MSKQAMRVAVGDDVVYGAHGVGIIASRRTKIVDNEQRVVVVISLADGLSVELPVALAEELLRPVAGEPEIARVGIVLRAAADPGEESWLKRRREAQSKLRDPVGLAEIIRDAAGRRQVSPGEREIVRTARKLLAAEIAVSRGIAEAEADGWIDEQLTTL
jgi:CarD family transcriptional regulator, regulator of rRNA transcription